MDIPLPFCEAEDKGHWDYTINVKKRLMNCWRGFDPRCESGHSVLTLISLYYDIPFTQAKEFIRKNFRGEDSLLRLKKRLKNLGEERTLEDEESNESIILTIPHETESIIDSKSKGAKKALKWLIEERKIPIEFIEMIEPRYLGNDSDRRWAKYRDRIFFPVSSSGNEAWLAYSTRKKSTKERPKTMNPPGRILSCMFFLYDFYKDSNRPIILNEGLFDSWRLMLFGYNALAGFGTTVSPEQIQLLNALPAREVVVCYDPDASKLRKNKKGKWTSRANRVAKLLNEHYFGDVSVMKLTREDPDRSTYNEIKISYKNRTRYGDKLWRLKRLSESLN